MKWLFLVAMLFLSGLGCQSTIVPVSQRPIDTHRDGAQFIRKSRSIEEQKSEQRDEVFLRNQEIDIQQVDEPEISASLFQIENPNNYLFYEKPRGSVGDILTVFVRASRQESEEAFADGEEAEQEAELDAEDLEEDLLSALPDLRPGEESPSVMTKIPFQVMRILPGGDAIAEYVRSSRNNTESNTIKIQVRIPASRLSGRKPILTSDLRDVEWAQIQNQDYTQKHSLTWEDEYTLRLSGFEEARSQEALELEKKRQDLISMRDRLQQRIVNLGQERQTIVRERDRINQMQREIDQRISSLENDIKTRDAQLEEQREVIRRQEEILRQQQGEAGGEVDE